MCSGYLSTNDGLTQAIALAICTPPSAKGIGTSNTLPEAVESLLSLPSIAFMASSPVSNIKSGSVSISSSLSIGAQLLIQTALRLPLDGSNN